MVSGPGSEVDVRGLMQRPPSGYFVVIPQQQEDEAFSIRDVVSLVRQSWKLLFAVAFGAAVIAAVVSLQMRKVYRAEALIVPAEHGPGAGGIRGQLGGLAALAGIDLGGSGNRKDEMIATLRSAGFAREFITTENLMPVLFAEKWDAEAKSWRAGKEPPTLETGVRKFVTGVCNITEDKKTGVVTVGVKWYSAELAASWANRMVELLNERARTDAIRSAEQSITYLNQELKKTNVVEVQQAIYHLVQDQVNNTMLANVRREYAFRFVDRAVAPETRVSPKRTAITLVGAALGLLIGLSWVFGRQLLRNSPRQDRGQA